MLNTAAIKPAERSALLGFSDIVKIRNRVLEMRARGMRGAGSEHISVASMPGMFERTISAFTLSKTFAMTSWRIGYVVADAPLMEFIRKLVLNTTNGVSTPTQYAAAAASGARYLADRFSRVISMTTCGDLEHDHSRNGCSQVWCYAQSA